MRKIAGMIPSNPPALVDSIVRTVVGVEAISIEHIEGKGMSNAVSVATTSEGRFVIRTNVVSHLVRFRREAWCFEQLRRDPVLVPEVLACGTIEDYSYSVARFIEASAPIDNAVDTIRIWRILGGYAAHLNKIPEPMDEPARTFFPSTWADQVVTEINLIFKDDLWIQRAHRTVSEIHRLREILVQCAMDSVPRGVCQFDLTCANAVIQNFDYEKVYLLDLEWACIAPVPSYQLACIAAENGVDAASTKAFYEGYGLTDAVLAEHQEQISLLTLFRVMRATAWARDRCPALLDENVRRSKPFIDHMLAAWQSR